MAKPEMIFIDWDGTLCVDRFWGRLESEDSYSQIQNFLFVENKDLIRDWMIGKYFSEDVVSDISKGTGLNFEMLIRELEKSCRAMELVSPEVLELVDEIRSRDVKVVIATDNMDTFTRWTVPALGLEKHFDGILNSFDLKVSKRTGDNFFGIFLRKNGIDPRNCVIIDDSEDREGVLTTYGFDYRKIERGVGLIPELKKILQGL